MAWTATDDFDSYSAGIELFGLNGGSGWSTAWDQPSGSTSLVTVQNAPAGMSGKAVRAIEDGGTDLNVDRTFSDISAGSLRVLLRVAGTTSPDDFAGIQLGEGASNRMFLKVSGGNLQMYDGSAYQTIQAVSVDTTYTIDIEFDDSAQPNQWRVRVDEGSWTIWRGVNGGGYTVINRFRIDQSAGTSGFILWVDAIGATPAAAAGHPALRRLGLVEGLRPVEMGREGVRIC